MNYRHAYHAGNPADVMKHAMLALWLAMLAKKEKPFRVVDTHAAVGIYDLAAEAPQKTMEAEAGIKLLWPKLDQMPEAFAPYRDCLKQCNPRGLRSYPGSPTIIQSLLRREDRAVLNELHPEDASALHDWAKGDARLRVSQQDAYQLLVSAAPPPEKRGLMLVDPPFEKKTEWPDLLQALNHALKRWQSGGFLIWYPLKQDSGEVTALAELKQQNLPACYRAEWLWQPRNAHKGLAGSGLWLINPPWPMETAIPTMLAWLHQELGTASGSILHEWVVPRR